MKIVLNGHEREFEAPLTLAELLDEAGFGERRVAVEVNLHIIPRSRHAEYSIAAGDRIEIVHAIGGG
ncbi:MAG: sulfur carrier protein ThiS [Dokdonella sp.]|uniref:sulfur carrier protein ThiS n=1 Tax=Dokdonella sp. TaxID=2291710 RepID=UPI003264A25B